MEIMYPGVIIGCLVLIVFILLFLDKFEKKEKYSQGKKVANTKFIKESEYYKTRLKKYNILSKMLLTTNAICIFIASFLVARIVTWQNKSEDKYNRDIILSIDISTSENEVNLELVKKFRSIIPSIKGDRIGIVIFNTAPLVYSPLTDDYDYIDECLGKIEKQIKLVIDNGGDVPFSTDDSESFVFWYGGTGAGSEEKGSSLIGDGLARNHIFIS